MQSIKGGFPNVAGTTSSELASTPRLAEQFLVIAWISQFIEHRTNFSFKQRQVNKAIMITSQITEHANIFFSTYQELVFSHLSLYLLLPCTKGQQCFTTATIQSFGHFEQFKLQQTVLPTSPLN